MKQIVGFADLGEVDLFRVIGTSLLFIVYSAGILKRQTNLNSRGSKNSCLSGFVVTKTTENWFYGRNNSHLYSYKFLRTLFSSATFSMFNTALIFRSAQKIQIRRNRKTDSPRHQLWIPKTSFLIHIGYRVNILQYKFIFVECKLLKPPVINFMWQYFGKQWEHWSMKTLQRITAQILSC